MWTDCFARINVICKLFVHHFLYLCFAFAVVLGSGSIVHSERFVATVRLECMMALATVTPAPAELASAMGALLCEHATIVSDRVASACFWALGNLYLRLDDAESVVTYWCHSIHLMFRVMPITSPRVLRCLFRLLSVLYMGCTHASTHPPGVIPINQAFAITLNSYQSGLSTSSG